MAARSRFIPREEDLRAAGALIQHVSSDLTSGAKKVEDDILVHIGAAVAVLAEQARALKLPGAIVVEPLWDGAKNMKPFNEVNLRKHKPRPAYANVVSIMEQVMEGDAKLQEEKVKGGGERGTTRIDGFPSVSLKDFKGDNRLYHIPRMLTPAESELLQKGIGQRGRALRAFVKDMGKSLDPKKMDCIKKGAFAEDVFRRIAARAAEKPTLELVDGANGGLSDHFWSIWYGPDIIRGPDENGDHQFFVVEDNLGYVGGFGDLIDSRKVLTKTFPELKPALGEDLTASFYDEMAKHYLAQVAPGEKVVLLYYQRHCKGDSCETVDNEDRRLAQVLTKRGILACPLPGEKGPEPNQVRLEVRNKKKVVLVTPARTTKDKTAGASPNKANKDDAEGDDAPKAKKARVDGEQTEVPVGLVIFLTEPTDVHAGHVSTKLRFCLIQARERIEDYTEKVVKLKKRAKVAEKSVTKVNSKIQLTSKDGLKSTLEMKAKSLVWTVQNKENTVVDRIKGPLAWNDLTNDLSAKLTDGTIWSCKLKDDEKKELVKNSVIDNHPPNVLLIENKMSELQAAIEKVGTLVGGQVNDKAPEELFRLLRLDNKVEWEKSFNSERGIPHLLDAYYNGGVKIANGPGFNMVEDKELCSHVHKLIKHYLGEEPILQTIPTLSFATQPDLLERVFDDPISQENVVVKRVDGRGGDAVWVGAKLSRSDFLEARPLVAAEPDAFIVQKYTALSQVDGCLTDLRGPAIISSSEDELSGGKGVSVSPVLWGRGVPDKGGNGKVNISDAGFQFTIATSVEADLRPSKVKAIADKTDSTPKSTSTQYKYIDKVRYERDLLELAEEFMKVSGKSKIDMNDAKKLWGCATDGSRVTPTERRTLEHIMKADNYVINAAASLYLRKELDKCSDSQERD